MNKHRRRRSCNAGPWAHGGAVLALFFALALVPANAFAGLILGAELRYTYEDNVVGLLSDQQHARSGGAGGPPGMMAAPMGGGGMNNRYTGSASSTGQSPGDYHVTLSAEAGGYTDVGKSTSAFAKGFAAHSAYGTYTDLDETDFGGSAGVVVSLSNMVTGRVALVGKLKRFGDSNRDSTSYGADAGLKERLTPQFWLNESVAYEKNDADSAFFTYTGYSIDVDAGYRPVKATTLLIGGRYLVETYDQPSGATIDTTTVYVGINHELAKTWALSGEYDLELSKLSYTGTSDTNNVLSVAIRYYY